MGEIKSETYMRKNRQSELIKQLSDKELILNVYFTQLLLIVVSFILSYFLFDTMTDLFGLFDWFDHRIIFIGGSAGLLVVIIDVFMMTYLPKRLFDDGGINERLFKSISTPHIFILTAVIAICEEILFRGVIQTHFGLIVASIVFVLVHIRYLNNLFLFINIVTLSFLIGVIFLVTGNLFITIFMHFIIDLILGLIIKHQIIKMDGGDVYE